MTTAGRISLGLLVAVLALIGVFAFYALNSDDPAPTSSGPPQALPAGGATDDEEPEPVEDPGHWARCPAPDGPAGDGPLAGVSLACLDGSGDVDLGAVVTGRPTVVNLWAYWCAPCGKELPAMAEFAELADGQVDVLTVHIEDGAASGVELLESLGVSLPAVADADRLTVAALGAPRVVPVTVLLDADGEVVEVLAVPFESAAEIADAVREHLGVEL